MSKRILLLVSLLCISSVFAVFAQTEKGNIKTTMASGDVTSINENKIVLQTKEKTVDVLLSDKTEYKRVSPENPSFKTAVAAAFSEIAVGDKLVVRGFFSVDGKSVPAREIYLMTKSDIAQKHSKETE